jgi:hypothetical protein
VLSATQVLQLWLVVQGTQVATVADISLPKPCGAVPVSQVRTDEASILRVKVALHSTQTFLSTLQFLQLATSQLAKSVGVPVVGITLP